mgnify:FL=1
MTNTKLLIGSLSNDLYRVATLSHRGSRAASRFFEESKRWTEELRDHKLKPYIRKILNDLESTKYKSETLSENAETFLMYSILLQNYALHIVD